MTKRSNPRKDKQIGEIESAMTLDQQTKGEILPSAIIVPSSQEQVLLGPAKTITHKPKSTGKRVSKSDKAGVLFPVTRLKKSLKKNRYSSRVTDAGAVYLASTIEYMAAEVLELAGNVCRDTNTKRITPRHIQLAVRNDLELNQLLKNVTMPSAGVMPYIHNCLLVLTKYKPFAVRNSSTQS